MRIPRLMLAALALSSLTSCSEEDDGLFGERVWVGEHLEVWATPEATICADSFEALDAHAEAVSQWAVEHGIEPNSRRWRYYWLDEETFNESGECSHGAGGCALGSGVQAPYMFEHEIVHAELPSMAGLFNEGLAGLLGGFSLLSADVESPSDPVDVRAILERQIERSEYSGAEGFTRLLLDRYPEQAVAAMAATGGLHGFAKIRDVMEGYGIDLDQAVEDYSGQCFNPGLRFPLLECAEASPWQTVERWEASGDLNCGSSGGVGPTATGVTTVRSFDIAEPGYYTIRPAGLNAWLGGCELDACAPVGVEESIVDVGGFIISNPTAVELDVGRYWLRVFVSEDRPDTQWALTVEKGDTTPSACSRMCIDEREACVESGTDPFECNAAQFECDAACP